jgi:hypothetical protein
MGEIRILVSEENADDARRALQSYLDSDINIVGEDD